MPDDNMPGGETFVRQMQYGKGYYRQKLGVDVTSGWLIDTFGHHAQMPQLLAKGGFKTFWFVRGVPRQNFPAEFFWEGIDGTPHRLVLLAPQLCAHLRIAARRRRISLVGNQAVRAFVNPVFELMHAPHGELHVTLAGQPLDAQRYAWDGQTLWLDVTLDTPTELRVTFSSPNAGQAP